MEVVLLARQCISLCMVFVIIDPARGNVRLHEWHLLCGANDRATANRIVSPAENSIFALDVPFWLCVARVGA